MGVIKKIVHNSSEVFVWKIDETENELLKKIDKKLLNSFERVKKPLHKIQWLASRALLTQVLVDKKIQFDGFIKDEFGKPHLSGSDLQISISHTLNYTALIISDKKNIGVDIETKFKQTYKLRSKFCNSAELDFVNIETKKSALIWSAKESIYKAYGKKRLIFKEDMRLIETNKFKFKFSKVDQLVEVQNVVSEQYVLTFADLDISNS